MSGPVIGYRGSGRGCLSGGRVYPVRAPFQGWAQPLSAWQRFLINIVSVVIVVTLIVLIIGTYYFYNHLDKFGVQNDRKEAATMYIAIIGIIATISAFAFIAYGVIMSYQTEVVSLNATAYIEGARVALDQGKFAMRFVKRANSAVPQIQKIKLPVLTEEEQNQELYVRVLMADMYFSGIDAVLLITPEPTEDTVNTWIMSFMWPWLRKYYESVHTFYTPYMYNFLHRKVIPQAISVQNEARRRRRRQRSK